FFRIERAGAGHLDDVAAPFALGAVQLDIRAFPAQSLPWRKRLVLHLAHADIALDGNALRFHEQVIGRLGPAERAETGSVVACRLMPVRPAGQVMHRDAFLALKAIGPSALLPAPQQGKERSTYTLAAARDGIQPRIDDPKRGRLGGDTSRREGFLHLRRSTKIAADFRGALSGEPQ